MVDNIGEYLKKNRKEKSMTQEEVATVLDISKSTYSRIESNSVSINLNKAIRLSKLFGFDVNDIYPYHEEMSSYGVYYWTQKAILFMLDSLDLDPNKAVEQIKDCLKLFIENVVMRDMGITEIYGYVVDNSDDRNFKWLMDDDDTLDEFITKVAIDMMIDEIGCEIVTASKKNCLEEVAETIGECHDCGVRIFSCLEDSESIYDVCFCADCYDALPECKDCGSKYYESNKRGYCIDCR